MAKGIKGITVKIGGDSVGLNKALAESNKKLREIGSELRQVNQGLKLDPKNTVLLAQKQELLSQSIAATSEKLQKLEDAQEEVNAQFEKKEIGEEAYRAYQREIEATRNALKKLEGEKEGVEKLTAETKLASIETTKWKKALEESNGKLSEIGSGLNQVKQGLKLDPKNTVLLTQKQELLSSSIAETSKKLQKLEDAEKEVNEAFKAGKLPEASYRTFQLEVSKTKNSLSSLYAEAKSENHEAIKNKFKVWLPPLISIEKSLEKVGDKFKKLDNATGNKISFALGGVKAGLQGVGKVGVVAINGVAKATAAAAKGLAVYSGGLLAAGVAVAKITKESAMWADEVNTQSKVTGISTTEIQKYQYAAEIIDVSFDTIAGSVQKLTRSMDDAKGGNAEMTASFEKLGVNYKNTDGTLRDSNDVFNDIIDALGEVENKTERDALAMTLMGKSAQDLNPLILGGSSALKELGDEAESLGLIMSEDNLNALNEYTDSLDKLSAVGKASKNILAEAFVMDFKGLADSVSLSLPNIMKSIAEIGKAPEAKENLMNSFRSLFSGVLESLVSSLPKFIEIFNTFLLAFMFAIADILPSAINGILPSLIDGFFSLIGGLVSILPMLVPTIIQGAFMLFIGLIEGLTKTVPILLKTMIDMIPVMVQALMDNLPLLLNAGVDLILELVKAIPLAIPAIIAAIPDLVFAIIDALFSVDWLDVGWQLIKGIFEGIIAGAKALFSGIGDFVVGGFKRIFKINSPSKVMEDEIGFDLGRGTGIGTIEGFENTVPDINKTVNSAINVEARGLARTEVSNGFSMSELSKVIENTLSKMRLTAIVEVEPRDIGAEARLLAPRIKQVIINGGSNI